MTTRPFGVLADGTAVEEASLALGPFEAKVISYGAVIRDLRLNGRSLVLGLNTIEDYVAHSPHFGAVPGRYANRIAGGRFKLDGKTYQLTQNENQNHLHGGKPGFSRRVWRIVEAGADTILLSLVAEDGEQGYPGRVEAFCRYRLLPPSTLSVEFTGTTDKPTIFNLAQHSYFNLDGGADILDHRMMIPAERYLPVDSQSIPTGEIAPVADTPFDFRQSRPIRREFNGQRFTYDHNFCLGIAPYSTPRLAAAMEGPQSGLRLEVWSTEPGVQFYDGFKINVPVAGLDGKTYGPSAGLCLETQRWPDSPNHPDFTSAVLRPGETYRALTEYRFTSPE